MTLTGKVMNSSTEERDLVGKDGAKRHTVISHVLMQCKSDNGLEIINLRSYDATWKLPEVGKDWITPRIRRYENFDGMIAEVSV